MTWQRTLDGIGSLGVTIVVVDGGYIEVGFTDGDRLTPLEAVEIADVLKRAARFAERERELAATRRRSA